MHGGVEGRGTEAYRAGGDGPRPVRSFAVVVAHPDDDVMGAVGIVSRHRDDPHLRFVLVHATDGAAGEIAPGSGATRETLGAVRREETRRAWLRTRRMPDRHVWLGFDDGHLADLPAGLLAARIREVLAEDRPDVVLTFGPDGVTGHPDHVAVGAATDAAFLDLAAGEGPGLLRLFHAAFLRSALDRANARRVALGLPPWNPDRVYEPRGVPDEDVTCSVDLLDHVDDVRAAFAEHRTQWAPPWSIATDAEWRAAAGASHLVQAWPPHHGPRLTDPFEGLPAATRWQHAADPPAATAR